MCDNPFDDVMLLESDLANDSRLVNNDSDSGQFDGITAGVD